MHNHHTMTYITSMHNHHMPTRYLAAWQAQLGASLPEKLLRLLRSEKENDLLRCATHMPLLMCCLCNCKS